jgi:hypothetical protein
MDQIPTILPWVIGLTAVFTCLNSLLNLLNLARGKKNTEGMKDVQISVDGKWTETMAQVAAQKEEISALRSELKAVLGASDTAKGVLEGRATERAHPT